MKRSRFSDEQIIAIVKEQEAGMATAEVCRRRISGATFYKWKSKYGGLEVSEAKRLRSLQDENAKLKKLLAEAMLDIAVLKDISAKNGDARREPQRRASVNRNAVAHARETFGLSERRACSLMGVARRVVRYEPTRPDVQACASGCVSWRANGGGSAIGAWAICWRARVWCRTTRSCYGSTGREG